MSILNMFMLGIFVTIKIERGGRQEVNTLMTT